jgi:hypothetical protein
MVRSFILKEEEKIILSFFLSTEEENMCGQMGAAMKESINTTKKYLL